MTRSIDASARKESNSGIRQTMAWAHTWAGLTLGWILYFMFVTGTAGYFDTEIDRWMQPERPPAQIGLAAEEVARSSLGFLEEAAPGASRWLISLPVDRNQPWPSVFWQGADADAGASSPGGSETLNGTTGRPLAGRDTGGGQTLYIMHWRLHYMSRTWSDPIITFATLFMLMAIVTGVIVHKKIFKEFFTFRPGKRRRSWLDGHNLLSVLALPFHLMITYSGLVFMMFSFMPFVVAAYYGVEDGRRDYFDEVFSQPGVIEAASETAPLAAIAPIIDQAEERWGGGRIRTIDIHHPGDRNARIIVNESIEDSISASSRGLVFDGVTGELLLENPAHSSGAKATRDVLIGLHEGLFAGMTLRWLYFFAGVVGTGMVATGLVMWTSKRRQEAERRHGAREHAGLRLVERLNIATVAGLLVAVAAYFWANRLLPLDLPNRPAWEANCLFITWLAMFAHATVRARARAWVEQLGLAAAAFAALPLLNAATSDGNLPASLSRGDWVMAGFDLTVVAIGLTLAWMAWRVRRSMQKQAVELTPRRVPVSLSAGVDES